MGVGYGEVGVGYGEVGVGYGEVGVGWVGYEEVWVGRVWGGVVGYNCYFSCVCASGIVGSGLCVFSRYQIVEVFSHTFRVTGGIQDFTDGEVFLGKGVLCCRIKTPEGCIAFFNIHVCSVN